MGDFGDSIKKSNDSLMEMEKSMGSAERAMRSLMSTSLSGGKAFEDYANVAKSIQEGMTGLGGSIGKLGELLKINLLTEPIKEMFESFGGLFGIVGGGVSIVTDMIGAFDAFTSITRKMEGNVFGVAASFGLAFDKAKQFSDHILTNASTLASADYGWITLEETNKAIQALGDAGIPFGVLTSNVETAAGSFDLYAGSIMHARGLNIELSRYAGLLSNAIIKQGLSAEDAMQQIADFGSISEETGLAVTDIASNLQGLSNNFNKLGLSAEFGRPILEGFTKTLSSMGLGIENALGLSENLSSALAGLTSDYSAAYVTFQRGGLDIGAGGGALGASIGMQAKLLEIEKSGGDQSQLAAELAGAMKDTLASFTGGQIITVEQAAADPALQAQYYAQTKLLGDLYDIQDPQAAARTLDYLENLDNIISSGDEEQLNALNQQIQSGKDAQDRTLGELEKLNIGSEGIKTEIIKLAEKTEKLSINTATELRKLLIDVQKGALDTQNIKELDAKVDPKIFSEGLSSIRESIESPMKALEEVANKLKEVVGGTGVAIGDTAREGGEKGLSGSFSELSRDIRVLLEYLRLRNRLESELR